MTSLKERVALALVTCLLFVPAGQAMTTMERAWGSWAVPAGVALIIVSSAAGILGFVLIVRILLSRRTSGRDKW